MQDTQELTLDIHQATEIAAPIEKAYQSLILRLTEQSTGGNNTPMPMVLEQWPGGRWYRDLGQDQGHLWGFVQVIKPPTLIELHGPMFMSYAAVSHVQFRLTELDQGCELELRHQVVGLVSEDHREGLTHGWGKLLDDVKRLSQ
ncbi:MAG: SRPBCC domain-containing protein [Pirellulales bacterium]|nr:SRPBCC domain-containing protein [Pirellulales bacterium]